VPGTVFQVLTKDFFGILLVFIPIKFRKITKEISCKKITKIKRGAGYRRKDVV
jgi:hypothetical protein